MWETVYIMAGSVFSAVCCTWSFLGLCLPSGYQQ